MRESRHSSPKTFSVVIWRDIVHDLKDLLFFFFFLSGSSPSCNFFSLKFLKSIQQLFVYLLIYQHLCSRPVIELAPLAMEAKSSNHWTSRAVPGLISACSRIMFKSLKPFSPGLSFPINKMGEVGVVLMDLQVLLPCVKF